MTLFIPSSPYFTGYDSAVEKRIFYMLEKSIRKSTGTWKLPWPGVVPLDLEILPGLTLDWWPYLW